MIRFGIVSISSIVERFVEGVNNSKNASVIAVSSRDLKKATQFASKLGIMKAYGSYEEMLMDQEIDAIYVAGVNFLHYEQVKLALQHGKHVLCEKPFVLEVKHAKELFELAKASSLFLMEAQKSVFLPTTREIKNLIESKAIGEVHSIQLLSSFPLPHDDHWMVKESGGCLYGSATYTIEPLRYLFNEDFSSINGQFIMNEHGCDLQCSLAFQIGNHVQVNSVISMLVKNDQLATYYGTLGRIEVKNYWKAKSLKIIMNDGYEETRDFPCESEFTYEIEHFCDCIEKQLIESPIMSSRMTIETCRIVDELKKQKLNDFDLSVCLFCNRKVVC